MPGAASMPPPATWNFGPRPVALRTPQVHRARLSLRCVLCGQQYGACVQCCEPKCYTPYHPLCARQADGFCITVRRRLSIEGAWTPAGADGLTAASSARGTAVGASHAQTCRTPERIPPLAPALARS